MHSLVTFDRLCGVPVAWGRWGRTGRRKLHVDFHPAVEAALDELFAVCPWGEPREILSGGAYVPREPVPGDRHATGHAFDLSGIDWSPRGPLLHLGSRAKRGAQSRRWLLACEAILRRTIPQVLGPWYDRAHVSHWHLDDRPGALGLQVLSGADVRFLQAALQHVHHRPVAIDSIYGPATDAALAAVLEQLDDPTWAGALLATARVGYGLVEAL